MTHRLHSRRFGKKPQVGFKIQAGPKFTRGGQQSEGPIATLTGYVRRRTLARRVLRSGRTAVRFLASVITALGLVPRRRLLRYELYPGMARPVRGSQAAPVPRRRRCRSTPRLRAPGQGLLFRDCLS